MLTKPTDLADPEVIMALRSGWGFRAKSLKYLPVGGGSHHWLATDGRGEQRFLTVTDLPVFVRDRLDTVDTLFGRLRAALLTALVLREQAGLEFVVAPIRRDDDEPLSRFSERYSLTVYRYLSGTHAGEDGKYRRGVDRRTVLDLLVRLHRVRADETLADDFVLPHRDKLLRALDDRDRTWDGGPYGERARQLLLTHAADLEKLTAAYDTLAERLASRPGRAVVTHGEPHAGNVMITPDGLVLIDWDTVRLAPPERDLWTLSEDDPSLLGRYSAATGRTLDPDALSFYRLWFDLAEIGEYLGLFHEAHEQTADSAEGWRNLTNHLRPAQRWPELLRRETRGMPNDREQRRATFDSVADRYHQARPEYPNALYEELIELAGLHPGDRLLEIGCATGKATIPLAERGFPITCIELGDELAGQARWNLAAYPEVDVFQGAFEEWDPPSADGYSLVFAATAWHWIDPDVRYQKAWTALRPGGHLAFWAAQHVYPPDADPIFDEIQPVYDEIGEGRPSDWIGQRLDQLPDSADEITASGLFTDVRVRRIGWETSYTADQYLALLATFSDHIAMDRAKRDRLYGEIRRLLAGRPDGRLRRHWGVVLHVTRRSE